MFGIDPDKLYDLVEPGESLARLPARPRLLPALKREPRLLLPDRTKAVKLWE